MDKEEKRKRQKINRDKYMSKPGVRDEVNRKARLRYSTDGRWEKQLWDRFKMPPEEYWSMHADQKGLCAICGKAQCVGTKLDADHDHITGKVRRLLCRHCNAGLGMFKDNIELLKKAADYLASFIEKDLTTALEYDSFDRSVPVRKYYRRFMAQIEEVLAALVEESNEAKKRDVTLLEMIESLQRTLTNAFREQGYDFAKLAALESSRRRDAIQNQVDVPMDAEEADPEVRDEIAKRILKNAPQKDGEV